jgi:hypothetical protein
MSSFFLGSILLISMGEKILNPRKKNSWVSTKEIKSLTVISLTKKRNTGTVIAIAEKKQVNVNGSSTDI